MVSSYPILLINTGFITPEDNDLDPASQNTMLVSEETPLLLIGQ